MTNYHSLNLGNVVGELALGLDLDRNNLPLADKNDVKDEIRIKKCVQL